MNFILELQEKSGKQEITLAMIAEEAEKSVKEGRVVLIMIGMHLHHVILSAMGDETSLILKPGTYKVVKAGDKYGLQWAHDGEVEVLCQVKDKSDKWNLVPGRKLLIVREDMQIVIPGIVAVRSYLGEDDYGIMCSLAMGKAPPLDFVSRHVGKVPAEGRKRRRESLSPGKPEKRGKGSLIIHHHHHHHHYSCHPRRRERKAHERYESKCVVLLILPF
jgi:hypothetical protein